MGSVRHGRHGGEEMRPSNNTNDECVRDERGHRCDPLMIVADR